jgi:hypothetical protein
VIPFAFGLVEDRQAGSQARAHFGWAAVHVRDLQTGAPVLQMPLVRFTVEHEQNVFGFKL